MLKKILIFILGLVALLLLIAFFLPSSFNVERSVTINAPVDEVYNNVADFNNYLTWNPWSKMDPEAQNTITGEGKGVGASWSWDGKVVGKGSLTYTSLQELKSVASKLVFTSPRQSEANDLWTFETTSGGTKVTWTMSGELSYPIERYVGMMMDGMLGKDLENGLANLKEKCENK